MQVLEPIGRHALNVRVTLQRLQPGVSEVHRRTMSVGVGLGRPATQKANPYEPCSMGPGLSLLSREAVCPLPVVVTGVKGKKASSLKQTRMPVREATPSCFQRTTA